MKVCIMEWEEGIRIPHVSSSNVMIYIVKWCIDGAQWNQGGTRGMCPLKNSHFAFLCIDYYMHKKN